MTNTKKTWLVWSIVIFILLFISAVIYAIFLYMDLNEKRTAGFDQTTKEIIKQTSITEVMKVENYNGEEPYHVVYGKDEADVEKIIFYPLKGNEKTLTTVNANDTIPKEKIIGYWKSECDECRLIDVTPALLDNEILWEIVYYDEKNRYVFDYRSIYDGSHYEKIRYSRMFN